MRHLPERQFTIKNVNYCRSWSDHATIAHPSSLAACYCFDSKITDKQFILIPREVSGF